MAIALFCACFDTVLDVPAVSTVDAGTVTAGNDVPSEFAIARQLTPITQIVNKVSFVFIRCGPDTSKLASICFAEWRGRVFARGVGGLRWIGQMPRSLPCLLYTSPSPRD